MKGIFIRNEWLLPVFILFTIILANSAESTTWLIDQEHFFLLCCLTNGLPFIVRNTHSIKIKTVCFSHSQWLVASGCFLFYFRSQHSTQQNCSRTDGRLRHDFQNAPQKLLSNLQPSFRYIEWNTT